MTRAPFKSLPEHLSESHAATGNIRITGVGGSDSTERHPTEAMVYMTDWIADQL